MWGYLPKVMLHKPIRRKLDSQICICVLRGIPGPHKSYSAFVMEQGAT